jgi:hypothetical protein
MRPVLVLSLLSLVSARAALGESACNNSSCLAGHNANRIYSLQATRDQARAYADGAAGTCSGISGPVADGFRSFAAEQKTLVDQYITGQVPPDEPAVAMLGSHQIASWQMQRFVNTLGGACVRAQAVQASLGGPNAFPQATDANSLRYPDPDFEFNGARLLKLADGSTPPGQSNAEKARAFMAETLERLVRIFVAGTEQLNRDRPPYNGPRIRGMYEGYTPDILNSTSTDIIEGAFNAEWASCNSGIANESNGNNKWFKFKDGSGYRNETAGNGRLSSHRCINTALTRRSSFVTGRGQAVQAFMLLMEKMASDLRQGRIVFASSYPGVADPCVQQKAEIDAYRRRLRDLRAMVQGGAGNFRALECPDQQGLTGGDQVALMQGQQKTLVGQQTQVCHIASLQTQVEVGMVVRYAYCTWNAVRQEIAKRLMDALTASRDDPPACRKEDSA